MATVGLLYVATAARDIIVGDTPDFITVAATLGVAHAPGYPLFTMLGHLFTLLPLDPLPFRVNLLAIVCGVGAAGLTYFTARQVSGDPYFSCIAALSLALNPLVWSWSVVAEAFPLNNLLAAAMISLLVVWYSRPDRARFLVAAAFVGGLGLANHHTIGLLGPAILYLLWQRRDVLLRRPGVVGACIGAVLIGLLPYAYIPWAAARDPFMNWGNVSSLGDFVRLVTRADYGSGQLVSAAEFQGGSPVDRLALFLGSFSPVEWVLLPMGAVFAYGRARWYFWFTAIAFVVTGPAFVAYANMNTSLPLSHFVLERFFLLSHVVAAPLTALGLLWALDRARAELAQVPPQILRLGLAACGLGVVALGVVLSYRSVDLSSNHLARTFNEDILASLAPGAILLADGDHVVLPIAYLQAVEGQRPDVTLVILGIRGSTWYLQQLGRREVGLVVPTVDYRRRVDTLRALADANPGRPVALFGPRLEDTSLEGGYWLYRRGLIYEVQPWTRDVEIRDMERENERLLQQYRFPPLSQINTKSFELLMLPSYAHAAHAVGEEFDVAGLDAEARAWYERALGIYPGLPKTQEALAKLRARAAQPSVQPEAAP